MRFAHSTIITSSRTTSVLRDNSDHNKLCGLSMIAITNTDLLITNFYFQRTFLFFNVVLPTELESAIFSVKGRCPNQIRRQEHILLHSNGSSDSVLLNFVFIFLVLIITFFIQEYRQVFSTFVPIRLCLNVNYSFFCTRTPNRTENKNFGDFRFSS